MQSSQIKILGEILDKSWELKSQMSNSVSNDVINNNYKIAKKNGVYGGKVLGAGNGGFFFMLANPKDHKKIKKKLITFHDVKFSINYNGTEVIFKS
tara:strand:- start:273 stop:560 length:288 start_codon:yes stop_codon:yes gene_type:complete